MNSNHLTDEQMDELLCDPLVGSERGVKAEHLQVCASCSAEFESLLTVTCDFREAARASAEQHRRAARLPQPRFRMPRTAFAGFATAAVLCIAGLLALPHRSLRGLGANAPAQQMRSAVSDAQLLSEVQADVSSQVAQPMLPLAASVSSNGAITSMNNSNY